MEDSFSLDMEGGVESELIDLSSVSMTALRELNDIAFRHALQHVTQRTLYPRVNEASDSHSDRID